MAKLVILGSAHAVADLNHENTHMALVGEKSTILVDSVSNPIVRLKSGGIDLFKITDLVITHFHPDHVSGVPLFLMGSWLLGRKDRISIYGLDHALQRTEKLMDFYGWKRWPNFFPVEFVPIEENEKSPVLENEEFRIFASPVHHLIPTIGIRVESLFSGKAITYSSDTKPCDEVIHLAYNSDILIHEAAGATVGHSSAEQAGAIAQAAQVKELVLIHYPAQNDNLENLVTEASLTFEGPIRLAQDFMEIYL